LKLSYILVFVSKDAVILSSEASNWSYSLLPGNGRLCKINISSAVSCCSCLPMAVVPWLASSHHIWSMIWHLTEHKSMEGFLYKVVSIFCLRNNRSVLTVFICPLHIFYTFLQVLYTFLVERDRFLENMTEKDILTW